MTFEIITDHEAAAIARIIEQYKGKPRITGLISAYGVQAQDLEDILYAMFLNRSIDGAQGIQLDRLGAIVGVTRTPGDSDSVYLLAIKAQIAQNKGFGTPEEIIEDIAFLTKSTLVRIDEIFPASIAVTIDGIVKNADAPSVVAAIQSLLPAGVRLDYIASASLDNAFVFEDGIGDGFGDFFDSSIGGEFAAILGGLDETEEDDLASKNLVVAFSAETFKDIDVSAFSLNAQKCSVQVLDVLSSYQTQELDVTRPSINTIRLTSGSPITKTFRLIIVQAGD